MNTAPGFVFPQAVNPLADDKILDQTKLEASAGNKLNVTKMIISVFDRVENIVGKGEIACTSNFSFSHNVFKRLLSQTRQKVSLCGNGLTHYNIMPYFDVLKINSRGKYGEKRRNCL